MKRLRRIRPLLQDNLSDCAAASLAMILEYHGRAVPLRDLRKEVGGNRGASALSIVHAARSQGMTVRAFSIEPENLAGIAPSVVHWNFNHFVVLERWQSHRVDIVDPSIGRISLTAEEFAESFTGVVISFVPGPSFKIQKMPRVAPWRRRMVASIFMGSRATWLQVATVSILLQILGLALPVMTELVVARGPDSAGGKLPRELAMVVICAAASQFFLSYLRNALFIILRTRSDSRLTRSIVSSLFGLPFRFFEERGAADLAMRTASVSVLREMVSIGVMQTFLDVPLMIAYVTIVFVRDPWIGLLLSSSAAVQFLIIFLSRRRVARLQYRELAAYGSAQGTLIESIKGIESLKAARAEHRMIERWSSLFTKQLNASAQMGMASGLVEALLSGLRTLTLLGATLVGALGVAHGSLNVGEMVGVTSVAAAALVPLTAMAGNMQLLQKGGAYLDRLSEIMEADEERNLPVLENDAKPEDGIGWQDAAIELRRVEFRYELSSDAIVQDVSFCVGIGQKIALVGRSGSGKSTLGRILIGLHDPTLGEVLHFGVPMGSSRMQSAEASFGVVTQDPSLFTGSIRENISLSDPSAPLDRVMDAARLAAVHDEIQSLPMGYETMLSEGGGLSGGQRQRIALARALLAKPSILVLDEATSHLDTVTEAMIEDGLSKATQTRIVIAHRLSTVRDADLILVMQQGRIVERGTHGELISLKGHYFNLVSRQPDEPSGSAN